jgi:ADP-ribose pyrophosphatase YjhB (NUDIX family)
VKRLGVAGFITSSGNHPNHLLLGRRGKDPNRGLYVLPGGGVEDVETLEEALRREIMEETGLEIKERADRWSHVRNIIELPDRIILVVPVSVKPKNYDDAPRDGGDLYDVAWFRFDELPDDISPVIRPILEGHEYKFKKDTSE